MKIFTKNKPAFTMLELIFVIVVLAIIASIAMPRLDRDLKQDAADNILADIRYTQQLAMMDFKHNFNDPKWQKSFWRIGFESCAGTSGYYEYIGSDMSYAGGISDVEAAIDPANGKKMIWTGADCTDGGDSVTSDRLFLTHKYGVTLFASAGGCDAQYIGFDHLGRPHRGFAGAGGDIANYAGYMSTDCNLTFTMTNTDTFTITVQKETGYAFIVGQEGS